MLLIEEAIIQVLLAAPAVTAQAGDRISTFGAQDTKIPHVVVRTPYSSIPVRAHDGLIGDAESSLQIEVYHTSGVKSRRLAEACRLAIEAAFALRSFAGLRVGYAEANYITPDDPAQRSSSSAPVHQALLDCITIHEIETT